MLLTTIAPKYAEAKNERAKMTADVRKLLLDTAYGLVKNQTEDGFIGDAFVVMTRRNHRTEIRNGRVTANRRPVLTIEVDGVFYTNIDRATSAIVTATMGWAGR